MEIIYSDNEMETIKAGESVLIPASLKNLQLRPVGESKVLEIYIKYKTEDRRQKVHDYKEFHIYKEQPVGWAVSEGQYAGICIYWPVECRKIIIDQFSDQQEKTGQDIIYSRENTVDKPLPGQRRMVPGGPAWLWICQNGKIAEEAIIEDRC
jgi:hypothetical protein